HAQTTSPPAGAREAADTGSARLEPISSITAVRRALQHNPTLRAAELDLKGARQQVLAEAESYPYYLSADAGATRSSSAQLRANDTVSTSASRTIDAGIGIRRLIPKGKLAELRAEGQYFSVEDRATQVGVTPFADAGYAATFRASVSQPLLRGYGTRVGEAELRAARVSESVSEKSLRRVQSSLMGEVLSAYLELWYASQVIEIERESLD